VSGLLSRPDDEGNNRGCVDRQINEPRTLRAGLDADDSGEYPAGDEKEPENKADFSGY